jgi:ATP-binding cassette, subfamily F, member 3
MEFRKRKLTYYRGNFDSYVKQREEITKNSLRLYEAYKSKREHMMEFIEKFRANAKISSMVQSRIKTVAVNDVCFDYNPLDESGAKKPVDQLLLQQVNFGVDLSSRIAILGANGQGKT